jgi:dihydrofolate reductase
MMQVVLMMAQSVDGIIAKDAYHLTEWTCPADKKLFKRITMEAGVLIMGARTYETIGKPLPNRLNVVYTHHPDRLPSGGNVLFTRSTPQDLLRELEQRGHSRVILTGGAAVNTLFAKQNLIDEMFTTISPRIFGHGLTVFSEPLDIELKLLNTQVLDQNSILLHYRVIKT